MSLRLPTRERVLSETLLRDTLIRIALRSVALGLAEQQQVLRHADTDLGRILAHLRVAQPIGLIVLAYHIGHDGLHAHIGEAVFHKVIDGAAMKWIDRL